MNQKIENELAAVKTDAEVEVERTPKENEALFTELRALQSGILSLGTGTTNDVAVSADLVSEEEATLLRQDYVIESEGEEIVYTDAETGRQLSVEDVAKMSTEGGLDKSRRRRNKKPRKHETQKGQIRMPQFGKGKLLLVPQSVERERPKAPKGTITLSQLLSAEHPMSSPLLARIATKIVERGAEPYFVIFSRTEKGFDHVRVDVKTKLFGKEELPIAYFVITGVIGEHYSELLEYKDEAIHFGPLIRGKTAPRGEEKRTNALLKFVAEAANEINKSIASRTESQSK